MRSEGLFAPTSLEKERLSHFQEIACEKGDFRELSLNLKVRTPDNASKDLQNRFSMHFLLQARPVIEAFPSMGLEMCSGFYKVELTDGLKFFLV